MAMAGSAGGKLVLSHARSAWADVPDHERPPLPAAAMSCAAIYGGKDAENRRWRTDAE
jgi:hypothetical protein